MANVCMARAQVTVERWHGAATEKGVPIRATACPQTKRTRANRHQQRGADRKRGAASEGEWGRQGTHGLGGGTALHSVSFVSPEMPSGCGVDGSGMEGRAWERSMSSKRRTWRSAERIAGWWRAARGWRHGMGGNRADGHLRPEQGRCVRDKGGLTCWPG